MIDFDESSKSWDDDPMKRQRAQAVADAIRAAVPLAPSMRALEYGCGTGLLSFALQSELGSITLADTSSGMIEVLSEKIKKAGAKNMFPVLLKTSGDPLAGTHFDIIYSLMTLHHISDTDEILERFYKMTKPGGFLCIADLDEEDGSFHGREVSDVHLGFDRAALHANAEEAGFAGVAFSTVFTIHKEEREFPVFLMTARRPT